MSKEDKHQPKEYTNGAHKGHRKVFDVVPPGRAPASATSRPVIMGHKPPVPDDQFVAATKPSMPDTSVHTTEDDAAAAEASTRASNPAEQHALLDPKHKVEITPSHADIDVGSVATAADVQQPEETQNAAETPLDPNATSQDEDTEASALAALASVPAALQSSIDNTASRGAVTEGEAPSTPKTTSSVWEMPDKENRVPDKPHPASQETRETPTPPSTATSAVLQRLNDEEAKSNSAAPSRHHSSKTIDELLAETGAPDLGLANEPPQKTIISHHQPHHGHVTRNLLATLVVVIILAVVVADLLLDGGFITTKLNIPHTHFF